MEPCRRAVMAVCGNMHFKAQPLPPFSLTAILAHLEAFETFSHVVHGALQTRCDGCVQAWCLVGVALMT